MKKLFLIAGLMVFGLTLAFMPKHAMAGPAVQQEGIGIISAEGVNIIGASATHTDMAIFTATSMGSSGLVVQQARPSFHLWTKFSLKTGNYLSVASGGQSVHRQCYGMSTVCSSLISPSIASAVPISRDNILSSGMAAELRLYAFLPENQRCAGVVLFTFT